MIRLRYLTETGLVIDIANLKDDEVQALQMMPATINEAEEASIIVESIPNEREGYVRSLYVQDGIVRAEYALIKGWIELATQKDIEGLTEMILPNDIKNKIPLTTNNKLDTTFIASDKYLYSYKNGKLRLLSDTFVTWLGMSAYGGLCYQDGKIYSASIMGKIYIYDLTTGETTIKPSSHNWGAQIFPFAGDRLLMMSPDASKTSKILNLNLDTIYTFPISVSHPGRYLQFVTSKYTAVYSSIIDNETYETFNADDLGEINLGDYAVTEFRGKYFAVYRYSNILKLLSFSDITIDAGVISLSDRFYSLIDVFSAGTNYYSRLKFINNQIAVGYSDIINLGWESVRAHINYSQMPILSVGYAAAVPIWNGLNSYPVFMSTGKMKIVAV